MAAKINSKRVKQIKYILSYGLEMYHCCFCLEIFSLDNLTIEHILPKISGGTNELINLALSCDACNNDRNHSNFSEYRDYKCGLINKKPAGAHLKRSTKKKNSAK